MYRILGGDGKEYGPVSAEQLRQWVREGRANALTQVKAEGATQWQALGSLPELGEIFGAGPGVPPTIGGFSAVSAPGPLHDGPYELDIFGCLNRAWTVMSANLWLVVGGVAIYLLIMGGIGGFTAIPLVGPLFSIVSLIVTGPLLGGVFYFCLRVLRGQPTEAGEVFAGFRNNFGQLILAHIVPTLIAGLIAVPGAIVAGIPIVLMIKNEAPNAGLIVLAAFGLLLALVPMLYLSICWMFTIPLVVDKRLDFWPAMSASRAQVGRHWWTVLGLVVMVSVVKFLGMLAFCVGVFFAMPLGLLALSCAYETIFTPRAAQSGPGA